MPRKGKHNGTDEHGGSAVTELPRRQWRSFTLICDPTQGKRLAAKPGVAGAKWSRTTTRTAKAKRKAASRKRAVHAVETLSPDPVGSVVSEASDSVADACLENEPVLQADAEPQNDPALATNAQTPPSAEAIASALQAWNRARTNAKRIPLPPPELLAKKKAPKTAGPVAVPASFSRSNRPLPPPSSRRELPVYVPPLQADLPPVPLVAVVPRVNATRNWLDRLDGYTVTMAAILLAAFLLVGREGVASFTRRKPAQTGDATPSLAWDLLTSKEWFQRAHESADEGNFRRALGTVKYALANDPTDPDLLNFEGNMHQSLFQFQEARAAYERALEVDANNEDAQKNLMLCRRLDRYHADPTAHPSTLYGLHRVMLDQKRISEAIAISRRFPKDRALQQSTWQAALEQTGLSGKLTVEPDGGMTLDLAGGRQPDLSRLQSFPITSLNLANTGLEDIGALAGMPLRELDLSRTLVHDLAPLRDAPLQRLTVAGTGVVELSALARCPLRELDLTDTRVADLSPLENAPLRTLRAAGTLVSDLTPLATRPLTILDLSRTRVKDLQALGSLGLQVLKLDGTGITDLTPLRGCALQELSLAATGVRDLTPLRDMPVRTLSLAGCAANLDLQPLASCQELEHLLLPPRPLHAEALKGLPYLRLTQL